MKGLSSARYQLAQRLATTNNIHITVHTAEINARKHAQVAQDADTMSARTQYIHQANLTCAMRTASTPSSSGTTRTAVFCCLG